MLRRWLAAAAGAPVLLLCACTVPYVGDIGITVADGQVIALVQHCGGATSDSLIIVPSTGVDFENPRRTIRFEPATSVEVPLGSVAEVTTALGERNVVLQSPASFWGEAPEQLLNAERIEGIEAGEVFAGLRFDDRAEFTAWVAEKCGDLPPTDQAE